MDELIAALAERQHGVVARDQLVDRGLSRRAVERRLERRRLHVVQRGVYAVGHPVLTQEGRWMSAVLAARGILSHRAAGAALEIYPSPVLEVTASQPRRRPGIRIHCSPVPGDEITHVEGIPVTAVAQTLFDLAAVVPRSHLERALHEADVRGLASRLSLPDLLDRYPRRHGSVTLKAILASRRGVTRSELESKFSEFLEAARFPPPERNAHVQAGGRWYECDCLWREERLIVELDSRTFHMTATAFERDRARDRHLHVAGWTVIRVTWRQLQEDAAPLASDLRCALDRSMTGR